MALSEFDWRVRAAVYRYFSESTRAPSTGELAEVLNAGEADIESSLERLAEDHHLTLAPDNLNIWMAHPFSATPTEFPVQTEMGRYWANCAWDALAIPAVLERDGWTRARCAETGAPIEFGIEGGELRAGHEVIHFAVPPRAFHDNVGYT